MPRDLTGKYEELVEKVLDSALANPEDVDGIMLAELSNAVQLIYPCTCPDCAPELHEAAKAKEPKTKTKVLSLHNFAKEAEKPDKEP